MRLTQEEVRSKLADARCILYTIGRDTRNEQEIAECIVGMLSDVANGSTGDFAKHMEQAFVNEHRSLQQGIVRIFTKMLTHWWERIRDRPEQWTDLRNEASIKIAETVSKHHLPFY